MRKLLFCLSMISATLVADSIDTLDRFIEQARREWKVPGVSVSVVKDGKVLLEKGYGVTEAGGKEWVDEETVFQLASVTKCFTAAAIGVQVDRGNLGWDEEIVRHLPTFRLSRPYPTRYCTLRDLLAHRTGLPAFGGDLLGKLGYNAEQILERVPLIEPATSFRNRAAYSNLGYFIAGEVLAETKNTEWDQAVLATLLVPLQMRRSGFGDELDGNNVAHGHVLGDGQAKRVDWDRTGGFPAAGAMTSTAQDMSLFMNMLLNKGTHKGKRILSEESIQEMFRSSIPAEVSFSEAAPIDENSGFNFGMGWDNYHYQGQMIVEKGGGLDGIRTVVTLVPELNLGITILANVNLTLLPEAIRAKLLELYVGESESDLQATIAEQGKQLAKLLAPPKPPAKVEPASHGLGAFAGTFESPLYGPFKVAYENGRLVVLAGPDQYRGTLSHFSGDTFILDWPVVNSGNEKVTFSFDGNSKAQSMNVETLGEFRKTDSI